MDEDYWKKEPYKLWEEWCNSHSPPLLRRKDKDDKHGWHYDLNISEEKDGIRQLKFKLHKNCKGEYEELAEYEKRKKDFRDFKEKDEKKLLTIFGEHILKFLEEHDALESIVLPRDPYNLDRGNAKVELKKFFQSRRMIEGEHFKTGFDQTRGVYRFHYKFKDVSTNSFNCLRGKVHVAWSPSKSQAERNCAQIILDAIDEERKNRDSKNKQAVAVDDGNLKPEFDEILFCHGVRNSCDRFIEIRDGEFEDLKTDDNDTRNYVPTPMTKLKEIQNRKDVEFNFVLLWPKLKLKTKIDLPESADEDEQKSYQIADQQPNLNRPYSRNVYQCILKTFTRPVITVIGRGRSKEDAENDAAKKCLYHLHIQTRPELNWAGIPLSKQNEKQEQRKRDTC
ncbi:unnamed protein product [Oikopleura dioica]|uniref:DRBM domain-containing protein n=1 Tax=Oikopleura dioica TaxID=34765 RepID=E4YSI6_OIKDI|nr:unnamed protein product [Oikopleura dioica]